MNPALLPQPDPEALATSRELAGRIGAAIDNRGGWLDFETYMQIALYEPGLGYYSAGSAKIGPGGDFTTAPELGDWLARGLAAVIGPILSTLPDPGLLELGAGTGRLAASLGGLLAERESGTPSYSILEVSADLRQRQQQRLGAAGLAAHWIDELPAKPFNGVVLANEVADALPVARFEKIAGATRPIGLRRADEGFTLAPGPADDVLSDAVARIEAVLGHELPDGYRSEVCLQLGPWLGSLCDCIDRGGILLIDYGMPRRDYYGPDRTDGTLICHYRQRAHGDPLLWPGLQDISAWVDFSAAAAAGRDSGLTVAGFTTQGQFLLESLAADPAAAETLNDPAAASALKTLILPGEMGERFKLIWLTKSVEASGLPGRDYRNWL